VTYLFLKRQIISW